MRFPKNYCLMLALTEKEGSKSGQYFKRESSAQIENLTDYFGDAL